MVSIFADIYVKRKQLYRQVTSVIGDRETQEMSIDLSKWFGDLLKVFYQNKRLVLNMLINS